VASNRSLDGRALATEPAVLLIDELSMGLAPIIVEELYDHVRRIAASGLSILIVEQVRPHRSSGLRIGRDHAARSPLAHRPPRASQTSWRTRILAPTTPPQVSIHPNEELQS